MPHSRPRPTTRRAAAPPQTQRGAPAPDQSLRPAAVALDVLEPLHGDDQYRILFETMAQGVLYHDADGHITTANPAALRLLGLTLRQLQGTLPRNPDWNALHEDGSPLANGAYPAQVALRTGQPVSGTVMGVYVPDENCHRWLRVHAVPLCRPGASQPYQVLTTFDDITENKQYQEQLHHQVLHDALTGLPNRVLLADRLTHALARTTRREQAIAVLFIDLDHFKLVNDTLGHTLGDDLLKRVARRLQARLRSGDTLARFGGDEFIVLLEEVTQLSEAVRVAEQLLDGLAAPLVLAGDELTINASIGIALGSAATAEPEELLRQADVALYQAKDAGRGRYAVFDPEHSLGVERLSLERDLRQALARNELVVHYQPYVDLQTGTMEGVEALLRWQHPTRGWVPPALFIPWAEANGLIVPLGAWVLEQACIAAASWQALRPATHPVVVAVNISAREFDAPGLVERVMTCLTATGLPATCLRLEITESAVMRDIEATQRILAELKALGIRMLIDDFGTGYASLSYLTRFPIDALKLDQSFVAELGRTPAADAITRTVATLAHALHMDVTAEGIETRDQLRRVRALRCARGQGFYFSPAVPEDVIPSLLDPQHYLLHIRSAAKRSTRPQNGRSATSDRSSRPAVVRGV